MTEPKRQRTRLYLITPPDIEDVAGFVRLFEAALEGGDVACLQVRIKPDGQVDEAKTKAVAEALLPLCRDRDIALIINDSVGVCAEIEADGVHLGHLDMRVKDARKRLGKAPIIGATAKNSRHVAMEAGEQGADYVAFGAFFPSQTKADTVPAEPELLSWWQAVMEIPCVAIGGITPDTAKEISLAGADFVAVSAAVWSHADGPAAAVAAFNAALDEAEAAF
ncbi:thiamine phosphate synthase [Henriciella mobilis]|uniref:thiamine phosphate synthase n=1 Tax=Henriciella mobilis TaxID=2305467 RepID=UPI000E66AA29|nr:thiamine phosphate synthase [Henriciella mobilis]RIJ17970.1 thiamine phosphate synthase [Henriciella mobilis]RIJ25222.1 thiamine phosphate synthase [Henriciella mobilis]